MAAYWWLVVTRAAKDSAPWYGLSNPKRQLGKLAVSALAVLILWVGFGSSGAIDKLNWLLSFFVALGAFALAVFLVHLVLAPSRIHREQTAQIETLEARIENRRVAQEHIDALRRQWAEGEALWKTFPQADYGLCRRASEEWFDRTREALRRAAPPNELWMFETRGNFADDRQAADVLQDRLGKLRRIIDRVIQAHEAI